MNIISKIDGMPIQDVSAITVIKPRDTYYDISIGHIGSTYSISASIGLPSEVMLKSTADALIYKGTVQGATTLPGTQLGPANKGWTYKVAKSGYITAVKVERGDMIICNTNTATATSSSTNFDFIQSNLDPDLYSLKGHTHTVTVSNNTGSAGGHTPSGTISTTVSVDTITSKGNNKPHGTISGTYSTTSSAHSHSFTGTAATLSTTYMKSNNATNAASTDSITIPKHEYTPAGTVTNAYTTTTVSISGNITQASHSHTFTGTQATIAVSYDKASQANTALGTNIVVPAHTYTPEGSVTNTYTTTNVAISGGIGQDAHSHSFSGTQATITMSYDKASQANAALGTNIVVPAHTYTPTGSVTNTYTTTNVSILGNITQASHNHGFSGTQATITMSYDKASQANTALGTNVIVPSHTYTPEGTVTNAYTTTTVSISGNITQASHSHTFTGTAATITVSYQKSATVTGGASATALTGSINDHSYKPTGTISHSFSYTTTSITDTTHSLSAATHNHTFTGQLSTLSTTYTPTGTISTPTITTTGTSSDITYVSNASLNTTTTTIYTNKQAIVNASLDFNTENLLLQKETLNTSYIKATGITLTYATSSKYLTTVSATSSKPTFYGDTVTLKPSGTVSGTIGNSGALAVTGTIGGKYLKASSLTLTFYGDTSTIKHTHTLAAPAHTHSISLSATSTSTTYTPAGTLDSQTPTITDSRSFKYDKTNTNPTFAGSLATLSHTGINLAHTHTMSHTSASTSTTYTPAGTIDSKTPLITDSRSFKYDKADTNPTFAGTLATLSHTGINLQHTHTMSYTTASTSTTYTPAGTLDEKTPTITDSRSFKYDKTNTNPTFAGTLATLSHTGINLAHTHTMSHTTASTSTAYTPAGTLDSQTPTITDSRSFKYDKTNEHPTFAGTLATLSHTATSFAHTHGITLTTTTLSVNYTPQGTTDDKTVTVSGNITGTFYGTTTEYTVVGNTTASATSTFYGNAISAHTHSFSSTTTSATDVFA